MTGDAIVLLTVEKIRAKHAQLRAVGTPFTDPTPTRCPPSRGACEPQHDGTTLKSRALNADHHESTRSKNTLPSCRLLTRNKRYARLNTLAAASHLERKSSKSLC